MRLLGIIRLKPFQIMNSHSSAIGLAALLFHCSIAQPMAQAEDFQPEPGYISLFNGKDLTGWGYRSNSFDGKMESPDGRYSASNGVLVVHPREPAPPAACPPVFAHPSEPTWLFTVPMVAAGRPVLVPLSVECVPMAAVVSPSV